MARVQVKDSEATLFIDTRFYSYDAVLRTADAFRESCWVYLDGDPSDKLMVCLKPKDDASPEETGYEFYNHVLGLMKNA